MGTFGLTQTLKLGVTVFWWAGLAGLGLSYAHGSGGNAWQGLMDKWNIPLVHGSGVYVDLGGRKVVQGKVVREAIGKCPVYNKTINLEQPTTNRNIWGHNFLDRYPVGNSANRARPIGGGFAFYEGATANISPMTIWQLKKVAAQLRDNPKGNQYAKDILDKVEDDYGYCAWWSHITVAISVWQKVDNRFRYPFVWNEKTKTCWILYISKQILQGRGVTCSSYDNSTNLESYCFSPQKQEWDNKLSYNSSYVHLDHSKKCPEKPLYGAHFGQWNGSSCARMTVVLRYKTYDADDCAKVLFLMSSSDSAELPNLEVLGGNSSMYGQDVQSKNPFVVGESSRMGPTPHSRGVGRNYANWFAGGSCEIYDSVPDCLVRAPGQFSFTSLGSLDLTDFELPPCSSASKSWELVDMISSTGLMYRYTCDGTQWSTVLLMESPLLLTLFAVLISLVMIAVFVVVWQRRKGTKKSRASEKKRLVVHNSYESGEGYLHIGETLGKVTREASEVMQEAEPSFWDDAEDDQTHVYFSGKTAEAVFSDSDL